MAAVLIDHVWTLCALRLFYVLLWLQSQAR
jgi:hypothetical protein